MVIGMGVVFAFLLLLVGLVHLSGKVLLRFTAPDAVAQTVAPAAARPSAAPIPAEIIALAAARRARAGGSAANG